MLNINHFIFWYFLFTFSYFNRVCWPVRHEKTCSEERRSYVRPLNNERLRALPLTLIFKPESLTVTFICVGQR